jgi:lysophospholipase L1-like esterase
MNQPNRRRKHIAFLMVAVGCSALVSLLASEIVVRAFFKSWYDTETLNRQVEAGSIKPLIQPAENPEIFFELRPNMDEKFWLSRVVTNDESYRISPESTSIPEGAMRIAVLGDSTSFGYRVEYEESYAERLRTRLSTEFGMPIELRNYSVPAYNASQELHSYLDRVVGFHPDLLIVHHDHNDTQPTGFGYSYDYLAPSFGDNPLNSALLKLIIRQGQALVVRFRISGSEADEHQLIHGYVYSGPGYDAMIASRRELARETQLRDLPAIVMIYNGTVEVADDYREAEPYQKLHEGLHASLLEMGFYVLDMYPAYNALLKAKGWPDLKKFWISETDGHPIPAGHQFIADTLYDFISADPELVRIFETHARSQR